MASLPKILNRIPLKWHHSYIVARVITRRHLPCLLSQFNIAKISSEERICHGLLSAATSFYVRDASFRGYCVHGVCTTTALKPKKKRPPIYHCRWSDFGFQVRHLKCLPLKTLFCFRSRNNRVVFPNLASRGGHSYDNMDIVSLKCYSVTQ